ncbi:MAG: hypothetical protein HOP11_03540 [Saprospiraceae bacterium]|nr:hypothetical protein [Saprospiraceae bacterium]
MCNILCYICAVKLLQRLSKKDLCTIFGLVSRSGWINYPELRRGYFTNPILKKLGITPGEYKLIRRFDMRQSLVIVNLLGISAEEISVLYSPGESKTAE